MLISLCALFLATFSGDCSFKVGGITYDLSKLDGIIAKGDDDKISTYQYWVSVCNDGHMCEDIMTGQHLNGSVTQWGGEPGRAQVCWDVLAHWDGVSAGPLDASAPNGSKGFTLSFANGDDCRGSKRKTKLNMLCGTDRNGKVSGHQDDADSCLFIINYETPYACGGASPDWGINGTFTGNMTCMSPDCDIHPDGITVKGDCTNMNAVLRLENDIQIYQLQFDECGGYLGHGTLTDQSSGDSVLSFNMLMHHDGTVWITVNQLEFPYDFEAWIELKKM